jgi:hypothetical protein
MGSLGFLCGPPLIGFLSDAVTLPWALSTLILAALVVLALARRAAGQTVQGDASPTAVPEPLAVR